MNTARLSGISEYEAVDAVVVSANADGTLGTRSIQNTQKLSDRSVLRFNIGEITSENRNDEIHTVIHTFAVSLSTV